MAAVTLFYKFSALRGVWLLLLQHSSERPSGLILSQNGVGNSHCLAQVYEITVIAGITKLLLMYRNTTQNFCGNDEVSILMPLKATMKTGRKIGRERYSSVLFCLRTANAIQGRLQFHNTDTSHIPTVILMSIEDVHDGVPGLTQLNPIEDLIEEKEKDIVGVTEEVLEFATNIAHHPETWLDFPLSEVEDSDVSVESLGIPAIIVPVSSDYLEVGYTNDGKSTLLEQLPMANILAEDRLFAFQELHEIRALQTTPIRKECRFASGDIFTINHKGSGRWNEKKEGD
ncbi:pullulanase 1, chloroplastic [Tanacetum coccineum]